MKYFICGYKSLDKLPEDAKMHLGKLSAQGHEFLVRKLDLSDELVQTCLTDIGSKNVTVYSLADVESIYTSVLSSSIVKCSP